MLAGIPSDRTELVQELALLSSAGVHVARRQGSRQIVPTGLLHCLIVVASGRICFEADRLCRVGKILRQRAAEAPGFSGCIAVIVGIPRWRAFSHTLAHANP